MAETTAETVTELPEAFVHYAPSVEVDREVSGGDTLAVVSRDSAAADRDATVATRTLTVDELDGHSIGELLFGFESEAGRTALVGDHVLPHVTPTPFLQPPREDGGERPRVVPAYNDSLEELRSDGYDRFLPGHRAPIDDPAGRIDAILAAHEERTETVADLVDGPTTPVAVMRGLFEELPVTEQFPGMSEAVGHLDVLEARGRVTAREDGGMLVYEPSG